MAAGIDVAGIQDVRVQRALASLQEQIAAMARASAVVQTATAGRTTTAATTALGATVSDKVKVQAPSGQVVDPRARTWNLNADDDSVGVEVNVEFPDEFPDRVGTWGYVAGTTGTENVVGRVMQISVSAGALAGSVTINGGDAITIPAGSGLTIEPCANLVDPEIVFTTTDAYFIEILT